VHSFPASKATTTIIDGPYLCSSHSDSSSYITEASRLTEKLTTADVHEYFLSGALIYIGLQKWVDALQYLECVLLSPASGAASGLMLEAYQKWVLVGCLASGRVSAEAWTWWKLKCMLTIKLRLRSCQRASTVQLCEI
jgi:hypothetical protein